MWLNAHCAMFKGNEEDLFYYGIGFNYYEFICVTSRHGNTGQNFLTRPDPIFLLVNPTPPE